MSTIEIAKILKELRLKANMSQKQAYEHIGVAQSTFSSWETGKAEPPNEVLLRLCKLYGVTDVLAAFGFDGYNKDGSIQLNINEIEHIQKYRSLDDYGQKNVDTLLENEYQRCKHAKEELSARELLREIQEKQSSHSYVAAFGGQTDFKELTPEKAAEAIKELERIVKEQK